MSTKKGLALEWCGVWRDTHFHFDLADGVVAGCGVDVTGQRIKNEFFRAVFVM